MDKTMELSQSVVMRINDRPQSPEQPCLIVIAGPAVGKLFKLETTQTIIGRSQDANVVLVDDGISRQHAVIENVGMQHQVRDLGSTNGIFVNGERRMQAILEDGDRIRIGSSTIVKYSLQDEVEESFQKQMYASAVRDALTGVFNKRYLKDSLRTEFAYYSRHNLALSLLMIDIDHFKQINDTYGHPTGDKVLRDVAREIGANLRAEDILCRYGGEEFAVILRSTGTEKATRVAERIRTSIEGMIVHHQDNNVRVTVSVGVATLLGSNFPSARALVHAADENLYEAKRRGRNQTVVKPAHAPRAG